MSPILTRYADLSSLRDRRQALSCHNSPLTFRWERSTQCSFILLLRNITLVHVQSPRRGPFVCLPIHVMLNELGKKILKVRCTVYSALDKYAEEVPNSDSVLSDTNFGFVPPSGIRGEYSPRPQQQPPPQYPPPIRGRGRSGGRAVPLGARPPLDRCDTKRISLRGRRGQVRNATQCCSCICYKPLN